MTGWPLPADEADRLEALRRYGVLDTPAEAAFDDIVRVTAHICNAPIAVINLIDERRQWFKAELGLNCRETPRDVSICTHAILQRDLMVVGDTTLDPRLADNPLVAGEPYLRFYAGAVLRTPDDRAIGTLCVLDYLPRDLTDAQADALQAMAHQVMAQLELRRTNIVQADLMCRLERAAQENATLLSELRHRVSNNLQMIDGVLALQARRGTSESGPAAIDAVRDRLQPLMVMARQFDDVTAGSVDLASYLRLVCEGLMTFRAGEAASVRLDMRLDPFGVRRATAMPLGLIVNEFVTNSFKHAFADGGGILRVNLDALDRDRARLTLADDGPGLPEVAGGTGLGLQLIPLLARQVAGELRWEQGGGAHVSLVFPRE